MDGPAAEVVRGLKAEKDSDLNQIWDALHRRFGFVDEPERAMRRFDVRKQQEGESLAVFEQIFAFYTVRLGQKQTSSLRKLIRCCVGNL